MRLNLASLPLLPRGLIGPGSADDSEPFGESGGTAGESGTISVVGAAGTRSMGGAISAGGGMRSASA